jgi:hypothetical protein
LREVNLDYFNGYMGNLDVNLWVILDYVPSNG